MRMILLLALVARTAAAEPADFIADAKLLFRIAACGDEATPVDVKIEKIVTRHCKLVDDRLAKFREIYFDKGRAWFDKVVPRTAPSTVVYPFGGGDLLSALVAFPDATDVTTISLELAGDPRRARRRQAAAPRATIRPRARANSGACWG